MRNKGFPCGSVVTQITSHQAMQETEVCFLIWEDPALLRATKPMGHNY